MSGDRFSDSLRESSPNSSVRAGDALKRPVVEGLCSTPALGFERERRRLNCRREIPECYRAPRGLSRLGPTGEGWIPVSLTPPPILLILFSLWVMAEGAAIETGAAPERAGGRLWAAQRLVILDLF